MFTTINKLLKFLEVDSVYFNSVSQKYQMSLQLFLLFSHEQKIFLNHSKTSGISSALQ